GRPVELSPVDPHTMQKDRELAGDRDFGLPQTVALGKPHAPSLQCRPFWHAGQQHVGRFEQVRAEHGVTTLRDSARPIHLSRGVAPGCYSDIRANTPRSPVWGRNANRTLATATRD